MNTIIKNKYFTIVLVIIAIVLLGLFGIAVKASNTDNSYSDNVYSYDNRFGIHILAIKKDDSNHNESIILNSQCR